MTAGDVSIGRLRALLAEQTEHETLDYKSQFNPDERKAWVEFAKDVGAMQIEGGYVVFGADDNGQPTGELTAAQAEQLDEAVVRGKLRKWLDEPFEVRTAKHLIDGKLLVLMRVEPNQDGFCIFKTNGVYKAPSGKEEFVFREGEVFARHGSASERWQQPDVARIKRILKRRNEDEGRVHAYSVAIPKSKNVYGQAQAILQWIAEASKLEGFHHIDPEILINTIEKDTFFKMCEAVSPHQEAKLIIGGNVQTGFVQANGWQFLKFYRGCSGNFTHDVRAVGQFLEPEHQALLARIDQCSYFTILGHFDVAPGNSSFAWISNSLWEYLMLARELKAYVVKLEELLP